MPPEQLARGAAKQEVSKPSPTAVAAARGGKVSQPVNLKRDGS